MPPAIDEAGNAVNPSRDSPGKTIARALRRPLRFSRHRLDRGTGDILPAGRRRRGLQSVVVMGGRDTEPTDDMVIEVPIRGFHKYDRQALGLYGLGLNLGTAPHMGVISSRGSVRRLLSLKAGSKAGPALLMRSTARHHLISGSAGCGRDPNRAFWRMQAQGRRDPSVKRWSYPGGVAITRRPWMWRRVGWWCGWLAVTL